MPKDKPINSPAMKDKPHLSHWIDLMLHDHGFLRLGWRNLHQVDSDLWRSNQPTPRRIAKAAKQGIKSIIDLRGLRNKHGIKLEKIACDHHNLKLFHFTLYSRAVPDKQTIHNLYALFEHVPKPMLIHCKSGADRAGLAAALYLIMCKNILVAVKH